MAMVAGVQKAENMTGLLLHNYLPGAGSIFPGESKHN